MKVKSWSFSSFPEGFRKETLTKISQNLKKGDAVQLVGARGAGTSLLVRLITQAPKARKIFFDTKLGFRFLLLDANLLLERNPLTLSRLLLSLFGTGDDVPEDNVGINRRLLKETEKTCSNGNLVLIIDHVQDLDFPQLMPFFTNLSYIYGRFRPRVKFLFVSEKPFINRSDLENFGDFGKLLTSNVIFIPALNKRDSLFFIEEVEKQMGLALEKKDKEQIFRVSGGFPRTMKRLVEAASKCFSIEEIVANPTLDGALALHLEELSEAGEFLKESFILTAYRKMLSGLSDGEQLKGVRLKCRLTKLEEKLLRLFVSRKGKIISREDGIEKLWGSRSIDISDHAYDQIIHRLRKKLTNSKPKVVLETIRGRGHCLKIEG
jgi:energy-coupling factor transporter ATP-binding protein EcfA2